MPTAEWRLENPQITGSVPKSLYEQLVAFKTERQCKSIAQALTSVLQEYFDSKCDRSPSSSSNSDVAHQKLEVLEQRVITLEMALGETENDSSKELPLRSNFSQENKSQEEVLSLNYLPEPPDDISPLSQIQWLNQNAILIRDSEISEDSYTSSVPKEIRVCETLKSLEKEISCVDENHISQLSLVESLKNDTAVLINRISRWSYELANRLMQDFSLEKNLPFEEESEDDYELIDLREGLEDYKQGNLQKAIAAFNRIISSNYADSYVYYRRGLIKSESGDLKGALDDFNKASDLSPNFHLVYYSRGIVYRELGCIRRALDDLQRAASMFKILGNRHRWQLVQDDIQKLLSKVLPPKTVEDR